MMITPAPDTAPPADRIPVDLSTESVTPSGSENVSPVTSVERLRKLSMEVSDRPENNACIETSESQKPPTGTRGVDVSSSTCSDPASLTTTGTPPSL